MANLIKGENTCQFMISNAEYLPYKDCFFDKVTCSSSLEHFQNDLQALKEMNRVLRRKGNIVLTTDSLSYPLKESFRQRHMKQYQVVSYYKREEISNKLEQAGFRMLSSIYLLNSPLTSFFYKLFVMTYRKYYPHLLVLFLGYRLIPLFLIFDRFFGKRDCGYTLLVKAEKV